MADTIIAGISPGGLKETYEVKILVCYLLSALDAPLSRENIAEICTGSGITDYFYAFHCAGRVVGQRTAW